MRPLPSLRELAARAVARALAAAPGPEVAAAFGVSPGPWAYLLAAPP